MTNSNTLEGWLRKTNFSKLGDNPIQASVRLEAARMHALNYMTTGIREYSQWFRGKDNMVADSLSRDDDQSDEELTQIFCTHCPLQIPPHFEIQPLPSKITLWLTALLLKLPVKTQFNKKHTRTSLGHGTDGQSTADGSASRTLSSAMREARTSGPSYDQLAHGSVTTAISHVCQTFREHGRPNPSLDNDRKPGFLLQWELRSFKKADPAEKHQKAIPMAVISTMAKQQLSELDHSIVQLTGLGMFFAFQSCKYLKVPQAEQGQMEILKCATSDSSKMAQSSRIPIQTSNSRTASLSHLSAKRDKTRMTPSHKKQPATQSFAPSALLLALSDASVHTQELHWTPTSLPTCPTDSSTTSRPNR